MDSTFAHRHLLGWWGRRAAILSLVCLISTVLSAQSVITGTNWFPIGPADVTNGQTYGTSRVNTSGRASVITVNPQNPDDVWLGSATGGVWHSTNAGVNWLPMSDNEASLSIGAIALDGCASTGCAIIYAGTGENSIRRDTYYGMGLLVGQNSGGEISTFGWTLKGSNLFKFASINNVVLDPSTSGASKVIYVTLSSGETASATESTVTAPAPPQGYGVYKSTDNGDNWSLLNIPSASGLKATSLVMDPTSSSTLYAGIMGKGVFKTTNGGTTWCPLNPGIPLPSGCTAATGLPNPTTTTFDHVEIAIYRPAASSPAVLFVEQANCVNFVVDSCTPSIYKSTDNGNSWTQATASTSPGCVSPSVYSRYTHGLTITPGNPAALFLAGVYLYKSTDSGNTFCDIGTNSVHPDHHAVVFPDPANANRLYDVSDGGFAYSADGGNNWTSGNSDLQITGFQSMASSALTARVIGGTQDNGTEMWLGTRVWDHRHDGDTGSNILDLDNVLTMFDTNYYISPNRSTNGGSLAGWGSITTGINFSDPTAFYPPLVEARAGSHNLYFGTNRLYQSTDKATWTSVSPVLGGTTPVFPDINTTNVITAIAVAPSNASRIYIGYYDGQMYVTNGACNTAACWTSVGGAAKGLPSAPITRLAVDASSADVAYATYSGFGTGAHVFKTTNGGSTWAAVGNGLPTIPTNTILVENSTTLWVGTDDGVYQSTNAGASWSRYGFGLPHVPVYEITLDATRGRLYAGTHGRGTFILTQPFLSNFEGWVNNDIWDIPVYGNGFVGSLSNPPGSACTMQLIQRNGAVCASSTTDAMGGTISFDSSGTLVTSKGGFYNGKNVAWGCFNGSCIAGKTIAQCNPASNPLTSVTVTCGVQVGIDHILGCPAQANPPSSILGLSGMPGTGAGGGAPLLAAAAAAGQITDAASFDVIPSLQGRNGAQVLCTANVQLQKGDSPLKALQKAGDAVNSDPVCRANSVSAAIHGVPPDPVQIEDMLASPPSLSLSGLSLVGGQLFTSVRAPAGAATRQCFDVNEIGSPLQNQIAIMKVDLETSPGGAAGGDITVAERSSLGSCVAKVHADPGETAAQIANALANVFQAPGVPGPASCPASQNPRDITVDGTALVSVLASELRVCNSDSNVGFLIGPKELPNVKHRALQYSVKFLCGAMEEKRGHDDDDRRHERNPLAEGRYYTVINIHNPTDRPAVLRIKFASASENGKPGPISRFFEIRLGADEVVSLDCSQIFKLLDTKYDFIDGFAVVETDVELDVVAVYTAAEEHGGVKTLHTERVPARLQQ